MKLKFLGCSNLMPFPGMGQPGVALDIDGHLYLFDCGDAIATKLSLDTTIEIRNMQAIFISHPHVDHIGGLSALLSLIVLDQLQHAKQPRERPVDVFIPGREVKQLTEALFRHMKIPGTKYWQTKEIDPAGEIFRDRHMAVSSFPTLHDDNSYGFVISAQDKKLVYTGDIPGPEPIAKHTDNADVLIIEGGCHFPIKKFVRRCAAKRSAISS